MADQSKKFSSNEAVEMMHKHASASFREIADFAKKHKLDGGELIDLLIEASDEMAAQAIVVSMRDHLNYDKPKD